MAAVNVNILSQHAMKKVRYLTTTEQCQKIQNVDAIIPTITPLVAIHAINVIVIPQQMIVHVT